MPRNPDLPMLRGRWPLLGHLPGIARSGLELLRDAQARHGPVFWIEIGYRNPVLMFMQEDAFAIFKNRDTDSSQFADFESFLGRSMLTVDGPDHRRMRMSSSPAFTPAGLSRARVGAIVAETLERQIQAWHDHDQVQLVHTTKSIALEVIFRVMNIEVSDLPEWSYWFGEFMLGGLNFPFTFPGSPRWRALRARRWLEARVRKIVADARERGDRDSIVGSMAHGVDDQGAGMTEQELIDNLLILGFAGHETTASTMAWSLLHLARSPKRWQQLCEESCALSEIPRDYTELERAAPLAIAVFRESLRLYPPVAVDTRRAIRPFELCGLQIPTGTVCGMSFLHLSRDPDRYEQPDAWRPERWIDLGRKPTPIENCQFGGGPHFCLGFHMALLEGTMFLVHVARTLSSWGRRPLVDALPRARYMPLTQPPRKLSLALPRR